MDRSAVEANLCDCFFNKTEVMENGGWEENDESGMAAPGKDPIKCEAYCKTRFLETVSADYTETFSSVCAKLSTGGPNQDLWPLYWCDSTYCGVGIDQQVPGGQDPNVDWIINTCNNIGYHSVFDPGPPPLDYKCNTNANNVDGAPGGLCANFHLPVQTSSVAAGAEPAHTSTWQSAMLTTQSGPPPKPTASTGVPVAAETDPLSPDSPGASNPASPLDAGTKVAIGISSGLGFLLVACLALFLLRRRHHKRRDCNPPSSVKNRIRYPCDFPPPGSSMTPLIPSPTTTREPLTPPLRLRDRRFLPSILRQSRSPSPPLTPLDPVNLPPHAAAAFPSSPICSPTINRLVPRHERTPKFYQYSSTPPSSPSFLPPLPPPPAYFHDHDRGSLGSTSTFAPSTKSTTSTGVGPSNSLSSLRNDTVSLLSLPPLPPPPPAPNPPQHQTSPTRPPRPHETPLVIPDLVSPTSPAASTTSPGVVSPPTSPAGPPPNRALPACPVQTPAIVVEGASPGPSPGGAGEVSGRGWGGQKIGGRELGESRG